MRIRIQQIGAQAVYKELVSREAARPNSEQHASGHLFGRLLYEAEGIQGVSICDQNLFAGCFHEFIARAIIDKGFSVIQRMETACEAQSWPVACQHGIGHGLIAYLGYTTLSLNKALDECSKLPERDPTKGCYGGALMEMNLQTMNGAIPRLFSENKPRGICDEVAKVYRPSCFFWLPQWWRESHLKNLSLSEMFAGQGSLCIETAANREERKFCFEGIGYTVPPAVEFDFEKSKALCEDVSSDAQDQTYCWDVASEAAGHKGF